MNNFDNFKCAPELLFNIFWIVPTTILARAMAKTPFMLGAIKAVTLASWVTAKTMIERLQKIPKLDVAGKYGCIPVRQFEIKGSKGLKAKLILDLFKVDFASPTIDMGDFCWLYFKYSNGNAKRIRWFQWRCPRKLRISNIKSCSFTFCE